MGYVPDHIRDEFTRRTGQDFSPGVAVTKLEDGNWMITDREAQWVVKKVGSGLEFHDFINERGELLDLSGYVEKRTEIDPSMSEEWLGRAYWYKRPGDFVAQDYEDIGKDVRDYFEHMGDVLDWSPEEISRRTASWLYRNTRHWKNPHWIEAVAEQQSEEVRDLLLKEALPSFGDKFLSWLGKQLGVEYRPSPKLPSFVREEDWAPMTSDIVPETAPGAVAAPHDLSRAMLGKGPMLEVTPYTTPSLRNRIIKLAKDGNVPHQVHSAMLVGTDAELIQKSRKGVPTASIDIPVLHFHTPKLMACTTDINNTASLLTMIMEDKQLLA